MKPTHLKQLIKEEIQNVLSEQEQIKEELYDLINDLKRAGLRNTSRYNVEDYLGRILSSYEVNALTRAGIIRRR